MRHFSSKLLSAALKASTSAAAQAAAVAAGTPTSLPVAFTTVMANEAIAAGDLVVQAGDAKGYWADDPANNSVTRPTALAADITNQYITPAIYPGNTSSTTAVEGTAVLANGNIVTVWVPGSTSGAFNISIFTPAGVLVAGPLSITAGTFTGGITSLEVKALSGGGFVVSEAYNSTGIYPRLFFFDQNGNAVSSAVLLESGDTSGNVSLAPLANGNVSAVWYATAGKQVKVATFNSTGVQQGATAVIASPANLAIDNGTYTGAAGVRYVRAVVLPSGNLAVMYVLYDSTAQTSAATLGVVTTAGAIVSAFAVMVTISGMNSGGAFYPGWDICVTNDGGFAATIGAGSNSTRWVYCAKYAAAGSLVGAVLNPATETSPAAYGPPRVVPVGAAGYAVMWQSSSVLSYCVVGDAGTMVVPRTNTTLNVSVQYGFDVIVVADGGLAIIWNVGTAAYFARISNPSGVWNVSAVTTMVGPSFQNSSGNHKMSLVALTDAASTPGNGYAALFAMQGTSTTITLHLLFSVIQKRALIGVAQAAAVKGAKVNVQILGAAQLRLTLQKAYAADQTGNSLPGQKMYAAGNQAILKGLQAA